jgi:hypothetical protein
MRCAMSKESVTGFLRTKELRQALMKSFINQWNHERHDNKKLLFYNTIKKEFGCENYLSTDLTYEQQRRLTQFKTSSHQYRVETGRHGVKRNDIINYLCKYCSTVDIEILNGLTALSEFDPIIDYELHVLTGCGNYDDLRERMNKNSKDLLNGELGSLFTDQRHIKATAKLLVRIHERRFPKTITDPRRA